MNLRAPVLVASLVAAAPALVSAQSVQWSVQFGGPSQDRAFAIAVNASGLYVAGATEGALPGQRNAGGVDAFVMKCNLSGVEVWTRQFGTPGIDEILAMAVDETGIYVAGDTQGVLHPDRGAPASPHAFIRKYDLNGTEVWTREFGTGRREEALAVAAGTRGVYAAGDTTVAAPPYDDGFVAAFDAKGEPAWSREIGTGSEDRASAIVVHASGVYVAGATQGKLPGQAGVGDSDNFLRKFDLDGNEVWTRQFGTPDSDEIISMAAGDTGLYLAGTTSGTNAGQPGGGVIDAVVAKYDFSGQPLWTRQFGTADYDDALSIAVGAQGVYVGGNTKGGLAGQVNAGDFDAFVRKYDAGGRLLWTKQFGSKGHDELLGVAVDASGVYAVGVTDGALPGQQNKGSFDAFVVKFQER